MNIGSEEVETPAIQRIFGNDNSGNRLAGMNAPRKESAFALFNPTEEAGLLRMWNNGGISIGRSPMSQIEMSRLAGHPDDGRDESPLDIRSLTPLSTLMARSYFSGIDLGGDKDQNNKQNY